MSRIVRLLPLLLLVSLLSSLIGAASPPAPGDPRIVVLGTCRTAHAADRVRLHPLCGGGKNPALARHVASLAIHIRHGHVYLVDATPDLPAQIETIHTFRRHPEGKTDRAPVDGVLLTHAHIGHYLGLAHFGFESLNAKDIPTWVSPRMAEYLRTNGPWSQLVRLQNIALREFQPGTPFALEEGISVKPIQVPHRDEYTDTMAFVIRDLTANILYVPDTDSWRAWQKPVLQVLADEKITVALVDATFYSPDELPDRDVTKIKHPLITDSMDLLGRW